MNETVVISQVEFQNKLLMIENQNEEQNESVRSIDSQDGNGTDSESDDKPIWPDRPKKRRRITQLNFARVTEIFPEQQADVHCKLSELENIRPSKVLELVPGASSAQIAAFLCLAEKTNKMQERVQHKSAEVLEKASIQGEQDAISLLGSLKELPAENPEDTPKLKCPTDPKSGFMEHLKKLVPPDKGGSEGESVNFTKQFQVKILNLLAAVKPNKDFENILSKYIKNC